MRLVAEDGTVGERNDVALAGLNHKMGYRGTVNTLLNFGEGRFRPDGRAGAIGYLVDEPHRGLAGHGGPRARPHRDQRHAGKPERRCDCRHGAAG